MSNEKILIIDDSKEVVALLVSDVLPHHGYRAIYAHDGQHGLQMIREEHPDLILLDFHLPNMTGLDILQQMVKESISIPVVLMTGYGSELSAVNAFRLGAKDYLVKPFTIDEITSVIESALVETRLQLTNERLMDEVRRLKSELNRQATEMKTFFDIGKGIAAYLTVEQVLNQVLLAAKNLTQADESYIWLPDESQTYLELYYSFKYPQLDLTQWQADIETSDLGRVFGSERPFRKTSYIDKKIQLTQAHHVQAIMAVPLRIGEQTIGVLSVSSQEGMITFSQREEFLLSFLADFAAIAFENARVFQAKDSALAARVLELNTLLDIAQTITSSLELKDVIGQTIYYVHKSWNIEASSLWWLSQHNTLSVLANIGTQTDVLDRLEIPVGQGIVGRVVETGQSIYTNDVKQHPSHLHKIDDQTNFQTKSLLCVPLLFQGKVVGALQLLNTYEEPFTEKDVRRATAFAAIVAIAIMNAKIFSQVEDIP